MNTTLSLRPVGALALALALLLPALPLSARAADSLDVELLGRTHPVPHTLEAMRPAGGLMVMLADSSFRLYSAERPSELTPLGYVATPGNCSDALRVDDLLYVAVTIGLHGQIRIYDIADSTAPVLLDSLEQEDQSMALALSQPDSLLLLANGRGGEIVYDLAANPAYPDSLAAEGGDPEFYRDVVADGSHSYVALGNDGMVGIDNATPHIPTVDWNRASSDFVMCVANYMDALYFGVGGSVATYNNSLPSAPWNSANHSTDWTRSLAVHPDGYLYTADPDSLFAFDLSIPTIPSPLPCVDWPTTLAAIDVSVSGDRLYVTAQAGDLVIYDLTNPAAPVLDHIYRTTYGSRSMTAVNDHLYFSRGYSNTLTCDISDPANIRLSGYSTDIQNSYWLEEIGGNLVGIGLNRDLKIRSLADPAFPATIASYDINTHSDYSASNGSLLFTSNMGTDSVNVYNLSDPLQLTLVTRYSAWGHLAANDSVLFVVNPVQETLLTLDIANVSFPVLLDSLDVGQDPFDILLKGSRLHVTTRDGWTIYDVSDPAAVVELHTAPELAERSMLHPLPGAVLAKPTASGSRLEVVETVNPAEPVVVGYYEFDETVFSHCTQDSFIFANLPKTTVGLLSHSMPEPPLPFSTVQPIGGEVVGDTAVTLRWELPTDPDPFDTLSFEVWVDSGSVLDDPWLAGTTFNCDSLVVNLADDRDYRWTVHAVDRNTEGTWSDTAGFAIYMEEPVHDFSLLSPFHGTVIDESTQLPLLFRWERAHTVDPLDTLRYQLHLGRDSHFFEAETLEAGTADSLLVSELEAATWWWRVQVRDQAGNRSWSQQTWMLFQTLAVDGQGRALPTDYALAAPWPNPFNATASVVVALPEPGPLALTLHDLLGRRVAVLAERPHPAGWHRFRLDADRLASGTYFLRAAVPGKLNTTRRITLVK